MKEVVHKFGKAVTQPCKKETLRNLQLQQTLAQIAARKNK